jgi:hypothetical protein
VHSHNYEKNTEQCRPIISDYNQQGESLNQKSKRKKPSAPRSGGMNVDVSFKARLIVTIRNIRRVSDD